MRDELKVKFQRGRYLVPNAVTLCSMFCGFLSIIYATSNRFEKAALAIGISILLDGLDGRVARRLNATSKFGLEFDSFSDVISFGVAPAIVVYNWCFRIAADEFGVTITFLYLLGAASRLVRFNISEPTTAKFEGLPTPGAAGLVAAMVNFAPRVDPSHYFILSQSAIMLLLSYLMVSKMDFFSIKRLKFTEMNNPTRIVLGGIIALIWYNTGIGFLVLAAAYVLSGPVRLLRRKPEIPVVEEKKLNNVTKLSS